MLTEKNYDQAIKDFKYLLVEFYAPWCGHCKALAPEYIKAAQILREKDSEIKLAKVDGTQEEEIIKKMHVTGYPTLYYYPDGGAEPIKYSGGRMAKEIVAWVEKKIGPAADEMKTAEAVTEYIDASDVVVVGFFKDQESEAAKKYLDAVRDFDDYPCAITSSEEAMKKHEAKDGQVVLFKNFDERRAVYEGTIGTEALQEFVHRYSVPVVVEFNHETAQKIFRGLVKSHALFFLSKKSDEYEAQFKMIYAIAEEYRHKLMFVVVDTDEDDNRRVVEFLGLKEEPKPTMRIIQMKHTDIVKYKPESTAVEEENVKKFVKDYLDDKVPVHYLTEKLPEDWDGKPVKYLTGENFDEVAMDKGKNVLVEFYAPWCGHCKALAPIWDELAEKKKDEEDIVVAKIDATLNELPHTRVRSFPTIKLYKKETNEVAEYNGERTLEGLEKFLKTDGEYGKAAPDHDEL